MQIPVYTPDLSGNEVAYVEDAVRSGWISSIGQYVERFEKALQILGGNADPFVCNGYGDLSSLLSSVLSRCTFQSDADTFLRRRVLEGIVEKVANRLLQKASTKDRRQRSLRTSIADAVVVGSALIDRLRESLGPKGRATANTVKAVTTLASELAEGVRSVRRASTQ